METPSILSAASPNDNMVFSETHDFLKMEDLHTSPAPSFETTDVLQTSPPPVIVQSRPAKKRKSWGQELPEPKTTLPPRKRAKTDDEKEQRRIERIKRNRAAAHNSRERKRQETETLAVALAKANAELDAYRRLHGPLPASVVLPEVTLVDCDTPAPSLVESRTSIDASSPASPEDTLFEPHIDIKQEPLDTSFPTTVPPAFDNLDAKPSLHAPLDLTQHSAAMLCDLQCRSSPRTNLSSTASTPLISWWTALFLTLTAVNLQVFYKTLLLATWSLSPSRMARMMQASTLRLTSRSTTSSMTLLLSRSTAALAQRNAATGRTVAARQGASALPRVSLSEVPRARLSATAVQQSHHAASSDTMAFREHGVKGEHRENGDGSQRDVGM